MFESIWKDISYQVQQGTMITRLIAINVGVFILINVVHVLFFLLDGSNYTPELYDQLVHLLSAPSRPEKLIMQPWSIITHMFLHTAFFHLLFNMLYLYWFGQIYGDLIGDRFILPTYIFSGIVGMLFFMLSSFLFFDGALQYALGASAAVLGITIAAAMIAPDYTIHLLLLGPVKLKYIAIVLLLIDLFMIPSMSNLGGHFGHLGGALGGAIFVSLIKNGYDPSSHSRIVNKNKRRRSSNKDVFSLPTKPKVVNLHPDKSKNSEEEEFETKLNQILDKIKKSGKESLTREEQKFLEEASKRT